MQIPDTAVDTHSVLSIPLYRHRADGTKVRIAYPFRVFTQGALLAV